MVDAVPWSPKESSASGQGGGGWLSSFRPGRVRKKCGGPEAGIEPAPVPTMSRNPSVDSSLSHQVTLQIPESPCGSPSRTSLLPSTPGSTSKQGPSRTTEMQTFSQGRRMTVRQEVANALTMLVPTAWVLTSWRLGGYTLTSSSCLLVLSVALHMPFSVYYHLRVALSHAGKWPLPCTIDNTPRRLDQTGIHLAHATAAVALSGGQIAFALAALAFNAAAVAQQWRREVAPLRNQRNIGLSVLLCVLPMIWRGDWADLSAAVAWGLPGVLLFSFYPFGGYSHAIFHVLMGGYSQALVMSTQRLAEPPVSWPTLDPNVSVAEWRPLEWLPQLQVSAGLAWNATGL